MASSYRGEVLRYFRTLFDVGTVAGLTDGQLLERFLIDRGDAAELAFAALLERHGPMVWRVCRKVLRDLHDTEDAFQATFLVLARRAGAIRRHDSVASWLHGVALRVASRARSATVLRRAHEQRSRATCTTIAEDDPAGNDLGRALHEELGRLPGRFRDVAILCLLEGQTHEEAANQLGCPVGTIKSRLATARLKLRGRLTRRGLAPSAALVAIAVATQVNARGLPPPALVDATIHAAIRVAAKHAAAAGSISASVAALTDGVLKAMLISKVKMTVVAAMAVCLLGVGIAWAQQATEVTGLEPDRLREVERKLDRVLDALERGGRPGLATVHNDNPGTAPGETTTLRSTYTARAAVKPDYPVTVTTTGTRADSFAGDDDRLGRVERRIDELERRLTRLEQRLDRPDQTTKRAESLLRP